MGNDRRPPDLHWISLESALPAFGVQVIVFTRLGMSFHGIFGSDGTFACFNYEEDRYIDTSLNVFKNDRIAEKAGIIYYAYLNPEFAKDGIKVQPQKY